MDSFGLGFVFLPFWRSILTWGSEVLSEAIWSLEHQENYSESLKHIVNYIGPERNNSITSLLRRLILTLQEPWQCAVKKYMLICPCSLETSSQRYWDGINPFENNIKVPLNKACHKAAFIFFIYFKHNKSMQLSVMFLWVFFHTRHTGKHHVCFSFIYLHE